MANLFGQQQGRYKGMVQIWDAIGFDEVADLQKMPKEVITMMKTYCESGTFQRGQEATSGEGSIAMFGNTNKPVETMVRSSHLFAPMPDVIRVQLYHHKGVNPKKPEYHIYEAATGCKNPR